MRYRLMAIVDSIADLCLGILELAVYGIPCLLGLHDWWVSEGFRECSACGKYQAFRVDTTRNDTPDINPEVVSTNIYTQEK